MSLTALYIRTSTEHQGNGMDSQLKALQSYCIQKGITEYEIFQDFGISGSKLSRPGLDNMMTKVRNGSVSRVLVYSFSRFARSSSALLLALEEFKSLGVSFISYSENLDLESPLGTAVYGILASLAQLERSIIQERVKNGLKAAKARGKVLGRQKTRNSKLIQELRCQGLSIRAIAKIASCSIGTVSRELSSLKAS